MKILNILTVNYTKIDFQHRVRRKEKKIKGEKWTNNCKNYDRVDKHKTVTDFKLVFTIQILGTSIDSSHNRDDTSLHKTTAGTKKKAWGWHHKIFQIHLTTTIIMTS